MEVQLRPCPFCGGKARIKININAIPTKYVECENCKTHSGFYAYVISDEQLAEKWNAREEVE